MFISLESCTFMTSKVVSDNSRRLKTEISPGSLDNKHGVGSSFPFGAENMPKANEFVVGNSDVTVLNFGFKLFPGKNKLS